MDYFKDPSCGNKVDVNGMKYIHAPEVIRLHTIANFEKSAA